MSDGFTSLVVFHIDKRRLFRHYLKRTRHFYGLIQT
ncbi:hypothetical protein V5J37_000287 [Endozoicomonas sp. NE43]